MLYLIIIVSLLNLLINYNKVNFIYLEKSNYN
jgi:hypothetical protein